VISPVADRAFRHARRDGVNRAPSSIVTPKSNNTLLNGVLGPNMTTNAAGGNSFARDSNVPFNKEHLPQRK
jgi:hypothetical protein